MVKKLFAAAVTFVVLAAPLRAELKYTVHVEMKPADASSAPADPMTAQIATMIGPLVVNQLLPDGPADVVYTVGDKGVRAEVSKAAVGLTAGTVMLTRPNGDIVQLNPADQTYWKATAEDVAKMKSRLPVTPGQSKRAGQFMTIAGAKTEQITFDMTVELQVPEQMRPMVPPGLSSMTGEKWVTTDQFKQYAAMAAKGDSISRALGLDKFGTEGIAMRQVLRSPLFGAFDLEMVVTKIGEESAPAALFDIPAGYKEVPSPIKLPWPELWTNRHD
jgi:hypothetical protein